MSNLTLTGLYRVGNDLYRIVPTKDGGILAEKRDSKGNWGKSDLSIPEIHWKGREISGKQDSNKPLK